MTRIWHSLGCLVFINLPNLTIYKARRSWTHAVRKNELIQRIPYLYLAISQLHVALGTVAIPVLLSEEGRVEGRDFIRVVGDVVGCEEQ